MTANMRDEVLRQMAGLPNKAEDPKKGLKDDIRKQLRILDEQAAVNRYVWHNLPSGLTGQMIERMLYYRGQLAFFYMKENGKFYCLPYALDGSVDVYGRFMTVTPLQFAGGTTSNEKGKEKPWINGLRKNPVYELPMYIGMEDLEDSCVIIKDYTPQLSETIVPRQMLQEPVLDAMAEAFPLARTSLIANCGVKGVRVQGEDDANAVINASKSMEKAALNGNPWIPIQSSVEFQELGEGSPLKSEEYLLYMQALDNYRLSLYGLDNGGLFQKKSHMLEAEQSMNAGHAKLSYVDGLDNRQRACDIINSIWGLGTSCEPAESVLGVDMSGDGVAIDEQDQNGIPGEQKETTEEAEMQEAM